MPIDVSWAPSSAAPALYGASLSAGQEQFRARRRAEQLQLEEMAQRERMQIRGQNAQLQAQAAAQQQRAQEGAMDRQFRAQAMQYGAEQDLLRQQQGAMFDAEGDYDKFLMSQVENGDKILDQSGMRNLQGIEARAGKIATAQNLTPQDKQQQLAELSRQRREALRAGVRDWLPGERQKSIQERWKESSIEVKGPNGEIMYVSPDRSGAFREVGGFTPPKPTTTKAAKAPVLSAPYAGKDGILKSIPVPLLPNESDDYEQAEWQEQNTPEVSELDQLGTMPVGTLFKGPSGLFFERDESVDGYHPVPSPTRLIDDQRVERAKKISDDQAQLIEDAGKANRRAERIEKIRTQTKDVATDDGIKKEPLSHDEVLKEIARQDKIDEAIEKGEMPVDKEPEQPAPVLPSTWPAERAELMRQAAEREAKWGDNLLRGPGGAPTPIPNAGPRQPGEQDFVKRKQPPLPPVPTIQNTPEGEAQLAALLAESPSGVTFIDARDGKRKFLPPTAKVPQ